MYMAIDWTEIYKKYKGLWVALKDDQVTVVGSGKTFKEARDKARSNGYPDGILFRVPSKNVFFIGSPQLVIE